MAAFLLTHLHALAPYSNELIAACVSPFVILTGLYAVSPVFEHRYGREG